VWLSSGDGRLRAGAAVNPRDKLPKIVPAILEVPMPTYQYLCEKCGEVFEHVEHVTEHTTARFGPGTTPLRCPKCSSETVQHYPTQFFAKTSRKS
jgi:putative FmdB family regulatory protein